MSALPFLVLLSNSALAVITVQIDAPTDGGLVPGPDLSVTAEAFTSVSPISSVTAAVGTTSAPLSFGSGTWSGTLPLASVAVGSQTLTVTATDSDGGTGASSVNFVYDPAPILTVTAPAHTDAVVTGDNFLVAATCDDGVGDPCTSLVVSLVSPSVQTNDQQLASGTGSVNVMVPASDLLPSWGPQFLLSFVGTDSFGHMTTIQRKIWYETGPGLATVAVVDGQLLDFNLSTLLYVDDSGFLHLLDRGTGVVQQINPAADAGIIQVLAGSLTAKGFVAQFLANSTYPSERCQTYEWNGSEWRDLGGCNADLEPLSLLVSAWAACWRDSTSYPVLVFSDLDAGTTINLGSTNVTTAVSGGADFSSDGDLLFASFPDGGLADYTTTAVYRRQTNGAVSELTFPATGLVDSNLQANGSDVVYIEANSSNATSFLYDLTANGALELASGPNAVLANNGWVAWTQSTSSFKYMGTTMWWTTDWLLVLRDSAGDQQTLTSGSTLGDWGPPSPAITPSALTSSGLLLTSPAYSWSDGGQLWIDGGAQLIWDGLGTPEARGTALYVMHHDTLFCVVDPDSGTPLCPDFDAGLWDGGVLGDAGQDAGPDAGPSDGGLDGGHPDAGPSDAGLDAGQSTDAGGVGDGGDAGGSSDAGSTSTSTSTGGATTSGGPPPAASIGGCATAPAELDYGSSLLAILGAILAVGRRARRRQSPTGAFE